MAHPFGRLSDKVFRVKIKTPSPNFIPPTTNIFPHDGFFIMCTVEDQIDSYFYDAEFNEWTFFDNTTTGVHTSLIFEVPRDEFIGQDMTANCYSISDMLDQVGVPLCSQSVMIAKIMDALYYIANDPRNEAPAFMPVLLEITASQSEDITDFIQLLANEESVLWFGDDDETAVGENNEPRAMPTATFFVESLARVKLDHVPDGQSGCSICLEDFVVGDEVIHLPCMHMFHGDCVIKWLQNSNFCPLCRFQMPIDD